MNRRIALVLRAKNISPSQFAEDLGVQRSGISHILNGRNKPSLEFIQKLIKKYPDISMNWLMFGEGPMMNPYPAQEAVIAKTAPTPTAKPVMMELFGTTQEERNVAVNDQIDSNLDENSSEDQNEPLEETIEEPQTLGNKRPGIKEDEFKSTMVSNTINGAAKASTDTKITSYKSVDGRKIKRIVIFYDDRSFVEYIPGEE
jgi:transcriptional regulator with XRE-family HTH domain